MSNAMRSVDDLRKDVNYLRQSDAETLNFLRNLLNEAEKIKGLLEERMLSSVNDLDRQSIQCSQNAECVIRKAARLEPTYGRSSDAFAASNTRRTIPNHAALAAKPSSSFVASQSEPGARSDT